jgi:hypothetical protein
MKFLNSIQTVWQLISNANQGTPPLQVTSTTKVPNLNSDLFDDQHSSYYLNYLILVVLIFPYYAILKNY